MKQFVGLFAVGEDYTKSVTITELFSNKQCNTKGVYIHSLYCTAQYVISPFMVLPLLEGAEKGLYIGIISENSAREVKVIPFSEANQKLVDQCLSKDVMEQCMNTVNALFGAGNTPAEPTPEYVDQDR